MPILIVESPNKVKKIQGILGPQWTVKASVGHIRDLPQKTMGVDLTTFRPTYEVTNAQVVRGLQAAVKGHHDTDIYLATDPDREGEAIAWHVQKVLKLKNPWRVTFQEITTTAIHKAIAAPRAIDVRLVAAQEGRRVIDRLVGYTVSGPLTRVLRKEAPFAHVKASAGRVQTPAVRLVVEREQAIRTFVARDFFGARLRFTGGWSAEWVTKPWHREGEPFITDRALAEQVARTRQVEGVSTEDGTAHESPPPPFTTSSLQQAASTALRMRPQDAMRCAQKLFEAGLITYIRTDSPVLSDEAVAEIRAFAKKAGWPIPAQPPRYKAKGNAQEAHEAIRPTHIDQRTVNAGSDEQALYQLIWRRTVASQLTPAEYATRTARLISRDHTGPRPYEFVAQSRTLTVPGWRVAQQQEIQSQRDEDAEVEGDDEGGSANPVPVIRPGQPLTATDGQVLIKKTKPPPRYTEASLIKALEERGIGRPSTYAAIMATIERRGYVRLKKRILFAEPLGESVIAILGGHFSFADIPYTAAMESRLDAVAQGQNTYNEVVSAAWKHLADECERQGFALHAAPADLTPAGPAIPCPQCGKPLRLRTGKRGPFWGCSGYPKCTQTCPDHEGTPVLTQSGAAPHGAQGEAPKGAAPPGPPCSECETPTVRRMTAKGHPYYTCPKDRAHGPWWDDDGQLGRAWSDKGSMVKQGMRPARSPVAPRRSGSGRRARH